MFFYWCYWGVFSFTFFIYFIFHFILISSLIFFPPNYVELKIEGHTLLNKGTLEEEKRHDMLKGWKPFKPFKPFNPLKDFKAKGLGVRMGRKALRESITSDRSKKKWRQGLNWTITKQQTNKQTLAHQQQQKQKQAGTGDYMVTWLLATMRCAVHASVWVWVWVWVLWWFIFLCQHLSFGCFFSFTPSVSSFIGQ